MTRRKPANRSEHSRTFRFETQPNTRGTNFYHAAGSDPLMISHDEATKQTATLSERSSLAAARDTTVTLNVKVPVLITVGQYDGLYCDEDDGLTCDTSAAVHAREAPNFGPRACLDTYVVENAGHSTNLHLKAPELYNYTHYWLDAYTVNDISAKDSNGCLLSV